MFSWQQEGIHSMEKKVMYARRRWLSVEFTALNFQFDHRIRYVCCVIAYTQLINTLLRFFYGNFERHHRAQRDKQSQVEKSKIK